MIQDILNFIKQRKHIISTILTSGIVSAIFNMWSQIKINRESEKIKYEIKRKYFHMEIKTRNLLEIYPKLYLLIRESAAICVIFDIINKKISNNQNMTENELKALIKEYLDKFISDYPEFGLKEIHTLVNYYESSFLFISSDVDNIINNIKEKFMELINLTRREFISNKYQKYTYNDCLNIINRAFIIRDQLLKYKLILAKQMNKELDPL